MRMNKKRVWLAIPVLVALVALCVVWWTAAHQPPPQIIKHPTGELYRFAGVTYGTKNIPPTFAAQVVSWLPDRLANLARKYLGRRISQYSPVQKFDSPQLFVWFHRLDTNAAPSSGYTNLRGFLANESGLEGGVEGLAHFAPGESWPCFSFPVLPKRDRVIQCNLYTFSIEPARLVGHVTFPNPLHANFTQWQPVPLPALKRGSDMDVWLLLLSARGHADGSAILRPNGGIGRPIAPSQNGESNPTLFDLSVRSSKVTNELWTLHATELSDATGNVLRRLSQNMIQAPPFFRDKNNPAVWKGYSESLAGALWPDESAWRLKLEFKRLGGFDPDELVTFKNVPVPKTGVTNSLFLTNTAGGVQITLNWPVSKEHFSRGQTVAFSGPIPLEILGVELPAKTSEFALDFVEMTIDGNFANTQVFRRGYPGQYIFLILNPLPTNAQTADITVVVQKTRTVEFLVKPPAAEQK